MATGGSEAQPPQRPAADAPSKSTSRSASRDADIRSTSRVLLDQVLSQTSRAEATLGQSASPELDALRGVARRHRGATLEAAEPVVVDLVDTLLRPQFDPSFVALPAWTKMTGQIAQTLVDDPLVLTRLRTFWARLQEMER